MLSTLLFLPLLIISAVCAPIDGLSRASIANRAEDTLATVNRWRTTLGSTQLSWSEDMYKAALNTGRLNGGGANGMNHHPAQYAAEVIAPGSDNAMGLDLQGRTPFEISFIAWICERPSPKMGNACSLVDINNPKAIMRISMSGTGHYDILTDNSYKTIGCAFVRNPNADSWFGSQGQWTCDLHR